MSTVVAADVSDPEDARVRAVLSWRREQFLELGLSPKEAWKLALSDADLGEARRLAAGRCPVELRYAILA